MPASYTWISSVCANAPTGIAAAATRTAARRVIEMDMLAFWADLQTYFESARKANRWLLLGAAAFRAELRRARNLFAAVEAELRLSRRCSGRGRGRTAGGGSRGSGRGSGWLGRPHGVHHILGHRQAGP